MTPSTDQKIAQRYTAKSLEKKGVNKQSLQEELGWPVEKKRPIVCLPAGMSESLGGALMEELLPGLLTLDVQILILGKGSSHYGALFTNLMEEHNHRIAILPNEEASIAKMYAASDMALFFDDASSFPELAKLMSYGVVPIAKASKGLADYNPVQESGNAFLYSEQNVWHAFAAIIRAVETFKFPFDWRTIQRHTMESVE